jgi:hypothetical protein
MRSRAGPDIVCPRCLCKGQLKLDRGRYFRVDHYKPNPWISRYGGLSHEGWERSCYIPLALAAKHNLADEFEDRPVNPIVIGVPPALRTASAECGTS